MPKKLIDSYTGEEIGEYYKPKYQGVDRGLYSSRETDSASYWACRQPDDTFLITRRPMANMVVTTLCTVSDEEWAGRFLDWCVEHDRVVRFTVENFTEQPDNFFDCIERGLTETADNG